jgi:hypothetical protein
MKVVVSPKRWYVFVKLQGTTLHKTGIFSHRFHNLKSLNLKFQN